MKKGDVTYVLGYDCLSDFSIDGFSETYYSNEFGYTSIMNNNKSVIALSELNNIEECKSSYGQNSNTI